MILLAVALLSGPALAQAAPAGGNYAYSITSVNRGDVTGLQDQGVRTVVVPAGTTAYVTAGTGQALAVDVGTTPTHAAAGPAGAVYAFRSSPGTAFLFQEQSDGTSDRVMVVFQ